MYVILNYNTSICCSLPQKYEKPDMYAFTASKYSTQIAFLLRRLSHQHDVAAFTKYRIIIQDISFNRKNIDTNGC